MSGNADFPAEKSDFRYTPELCVSDSGHILSLKFPGKTYILYTKIQNILPIILGFLFMPCNIKVHRHHIVPALPYRQVVSAFCSPFIKATMARDGIQNGDLL
jgi:hypothetical protein